MVSAGAVQKWLGKGTLDSKQRFGNYKTLPVKAGFLCVVDRLLIGAYLIKGSVVIDTYRIEAVPH